MTAVLLASTALLAGCGSKEGSPAQETEETLSPVIDAEERFPDILGECDVIVDQKTGVNYLIYRYGFGSSGRGGITVLVNADGSPVVTPMQDADGEPETGEE